jgi:methylphosphotriester-DNA--protein-cysteine methyltransferase
VSYTLLGADGVPYESEVKGTLGGHSRTRVYGRLDCPSALSFLRRGFEPRSRVFFADEATAIAAGYRPCGTCMRERYRAWKAEPPVRAVRGRGEKQT